MDTLAFTHLRVLVSAFRETGETLARVTVHRVDTFPAGAANFRPQSALVHQVQYRLILPASETQFDVFGCKRNCFKRRARGTYEKRKTASDRVLFYNEKLQVNARNRRHL